MKIWAAIGCAALWGCTANDEPRATSSSTQATGGSGGAGGSQAIGGAPEGGAGGVPCDTPNDPPQWKAIEQGGNAYYGVYATAANDVWVVGDYRAKHFDGCAWSEIDLVYAGNYTVFPAGAAGDVWIGNGPTMRLATGSVVEEVDFEGNALAGWLAPNGIAFAAGEFGRLSYYYQGAWHLAVTDVFPWSFYAVWGASYQDFWVAGSVRENQLSSTSSIDGVAFHMVDSEAHEVSFGVPIVVYGMWGSSATNVYAVGDGYRALRYDGTGWTVAFERPNENFRSLTAVHGTGDSDIWVVGEEGMLSHFDGQAWTDSPQPTDITMRSVFAVSPDDVWVVGYQSDEGIILRYH